jgi:hypothetical protein
MKKIPLHFNKEAFDLSQELFEEKQNIIKQIKIEMRRLLQTDEKNIDYSNAKQSRYKNHYSGLFEKK